jgi:LEM3-like protein/NUMOD3 motif-containing protein
MASNNLADAYVYVLFRADGTPFYVGKGRKDRWGDHERDAKLGMRSHKLNIIREMLRAGLTEVPKVKIAEGLTHREAFLREIAIIAAIGRYPDGPLVNRTGGGDGNRDQSAEERAKTVARNRARVWTPEMRAKVAASLRGKKLSPETIAKRSAAMVGRIRSPEHRASLSAALRGKPKSPEHVAKMAAAKRGKPLPPISEEHKAAIRRANLKKFGPPIPVRKRAPFN